MRAQSDFSAEAGGQAAGAARQQDSVSPVAVSVVGAAPELCLGADELWQQVARDTADTPALARGQRLEARLVKRAEGQGWSAELTLRDAQGTLQGTRTVTSASSDCHGLDAALAIVVNTFLQSSSMSQPEPEPEPDQASNLPAPRLPHAADAPPESAEIASVPRTRFGAPPEPFRANASLSGWLATGRLPWPAFGFGLRAWAERPLLRFGGGLHVAPRATEALGAGAVAQFASVSGELTLCARATKLRRSALALCGGLDAGVLFTRTRGLSQNQRLADLALDFLLGVRVETPLSAGDAGGLFAALSARFPTSTPRYYYTDEHAERVFYHGVTLGVLLEVGVNLRAPL